IRPVPMALTIPLPVKVILTLQPPPGSDVTCMAPVAGHAKEMSSGTCHSPMPVSWVVTGKYRGQQRRASGAGRGLGEADDGMRHVWLLKACDLVVRQLHRH